MSKRNTTRLQLHEFAAQLDSQWRSAYRRRLLRWFQQHQRDLPWRKTHDPYAIWISESMLQQTQVATVIDYYQRFLERFPDVHALASADEQEVLALWAGLGYYRRARQLHAAAKLVVQLYAGQFPNSIDQLQCLPGIGRYTAGAIASIALNQPAPIVEANTERLYARLLKLEIPLRQPAAQDLLWQFAQWQVSGRHRSPGMINQAAMELGSLLCKPVAPLCLACPLLDLCPTAAAGLQERIPVREPKKVFTQLHHVALVARQGQRWLMRQNPPGAWWHGLWDFPRIDVTQLQLLSPAGEPHSSAKPQPAPSHSAKRPTAKGRRQAEPLHLTAHQAAQTLALGNAQWSTCASNVDASPEFARLGKSLFTLSHGVTRYRIRLDCWEAVLDPVPVVLATNWRWVDQAALHQLPLTSTAKKMVDRLQTLA